LSASNWDAKKTKDAMQIISVLEEKKFDEVSYCQNGYEKFSRKVLLKVHPDKCLDKPEEATKVFVMVTDAEKTLSNEEEKNLFCNPSQQKTQFPNRPGNYHPYYSHNRPLDWGVVWAILRSIFPHIFR